MSILEQWGIDADTLTVLLDQNPSLRGMLLGYVAEHKLREIVNELQDVSFAVKFDDHDRMKKGDLHIVYKDRAFEIESKSLQSNTVSYNEKDEIWTAKAQVDASDRRAVLLSNGDSFQTTLLKRGEFDILAVNCFAFEQKWGFVFARNQDLPHSTYAKYPAEIRNQLIASLISVTYPPRPPFVEDLRVLLDDMVDQGEGRAPS